MFEIVCITDRKPAKDFFAQIEKVVKAKPSALIFRDKDLSAQDYASSAAKVLALCRAHEVKCIFHTFIDAAKAHEVDSIHLSFADLQQHAEQVQEHFSCVGCSVHSLDEARMATDLGAHYLIYGHIFATDCKAGLMPRGLSALRLLCESVSIPVCAVGGINASNAQDCKAAGAAGVCMMSEFMQSSSPQALLDALRNGEVAASRASRKLTEGSR
jgi:thiamine-phosphate pyrophosphorylase